MFKCSPQEWWKTFHWFYFANKTFICIIYLTEKAYKEFSDFRLSKLPLKWSNLSHFMKLNLFLKVMIIVFQLDFMVWNILLLWKARKITFFVTKSCKYSNLLSVHSINRSFEVELVLLSATFPFKTWDKTWWESKKRKFYRKFQIKYLLPIFHMW